MSSRSAANVSTCESAATPSSSVAAELAAHEVARRRARASPSGPSPSRRGWTRCPVRAGGSIARLVSTWNSGSGRRRGSCRSRRRRRPALHAEILGHRDLHALDVSRGSRRARERVREAEKQHVVDRPLARGNGRCGRFALVERAEQDPVERRAPRRGRSPKGFSTMTRAPLCSPLRQLLDDRAEQRRRDRQVVRRALRAAELLRSAWKVAASS